MSLAALDRLVAWFIPPELAAGRETRQRARMFLITHFCGPFIGNVIPGYLFVRGLDSGYRVWVLAAAITTFWVYPFVLRLTGRYNLLAVASIQQLLFAVLWGCYFYGGMSSPFLPWLLTVPLLFFFYMGSDRSTTLWVGVGLITVNLAAFYGLYELRPPPEAVALSSMQTIGIVSTLGAAGYVAIMALYYAKILASQVELEGEMKGHLVTAAELRQATGDAERASIAKAEFLAKMSHELRTPLNAVIGYSQMLLEDAQAEGDAASARDLEKIHGAGHHLLRLVNEVLDLSKIEAGKMELSPEEVDAAALLTNLVDGFRPAAQAAGNELKLELAGGLGALVCDPKKTTQAISQIIQNAVKFTKDGRVVVSARRTTSAFGDQIVVAVRDTGIGMAPEAIPALFEKFTVAEDASSSKYGGTGLGLALSLRLCHLMGGDISAQSELGVGSTFTIRLPVTPPASAAPAAELEPELAAGDDDAHPQAA
ncbi:MAG: HAMP domain-containing histidine kinase [Pseudomonadota bacterium]|nr:HAMP domain-containing histidine kinase [Pseudomonadota bacterium]